MGGVRILSHKAANRLSGLRARKRCAPSRLMPAARAALVTLRERASASRKRSWRSAVQPSRRTLEFVVALLIRQLGSQKAGCMAVICAYVCFGWKADVTL